MNMTDPSKLCSRCKEVKPLSEFKTYAYTTNQGKRSVRRESRCTPCTRLHTMECGSREAKMESNRRSRAARPGKAASDAKAYRQTDHGRATKAKLQRLRKARMRSGQGDNAAIRAIYAEALRIERVVACCPVFALPELGYKMHVDHVMPLSKGGLHHEDNLQILPIGLNMRKGARCPSS